MNRFVPRERQVNQAISDHFTLVEMKISLRRHLNAALIECACLSCNLELCDAGDLMRNLRLQFDPEQGAAPIQDCFSDSFAAALGKVKDAGGDPLAARAVLPSGAPAKRSN